MKPTADRWALRQKTTAHYDKYPFIFDQKGILEEKLHRRIMGGAILNVSGPNAIILDIGSGMCRVAQMVREAINGKVISLDVSLQTLREAKATNTDPMVNGDNTNLPFRSDFADLVISNGVIMVTPDVRASFNELARIIRPGGTLVLSVYNRHSWYYYVYRYLGAAVRQVRKVIGDTGLKIAIFPLFHISVVILMSLVTHSLFRLPLRPSWHLFHDQFTTPHCTFHTVEELTMWAQSASMVCEEQKKEAANQLITLRLKKVSRS